MHRCLIYDRIYLLCVFYLCNIIKKMHYIFGNWAKYSVAGYLKTKQTLKIIVAAIATAP